MSNRLQRWSGEKFSLLFYASRTCGSPFLYFHRTLWWVKNIAAFKIQLSNCTAPRHTSRYQMEEIRLRYLNINCYYLWIEVWGRNGSVALSHVVYRGRHFSPSLSGDRNMKLGSKSDHRTETSWNIVQYAALVPRPEGLRSLHFVFACAVGKKICK